ncbi:hypothetical protein CEXT_345921 [Caerostris extrusa]|uniref:Uncharacterized protein n=1 Tax=Caerostris extrusa TaxID=172846 RepID=A0AAV4TA72_CAEEX|nr:hypothetical protein CEXT_345921 [Caerostris extrusa]
MTLHGMACGEGGSNWNLLVQQSKRSNPEPLFQSESKMSFLRQGSMSIYWWPCASYPCPSATLHNPTDFRPNALVIFRAQQRPLSSGKVLVASLNPPHSPSVYKGMGLLKHRWTTG